MKFGISKNSIRKYLKQGSEAKFCNYDGKVQAVLRHEECRRSVICLTTGDIFNSQVEAGEKYNMKDGGHISECCNSHMKSCGKHPETGQPLVWMYYDEYIITSKEDIINKLKSVKTFKVINLNTKEVFSSIKDASSKYNIDRSSIGKTCRGKIKTCGGFIWMYYDEYLMTSKEDIVNKLKSVKTYRIINLDTKEVLESLAEASRVYKVSVSSLGITCKGKNKTCGGYKWMYYDDYLKLQEE